MKEQTKNSSMRYLVSMKQFNQIYKIHFASACLRTLCNLGALGDSTCLIKSRKADKGQKLVVALYEYCWTRQYNRATSSDPTSYNLWRHPSGQEILFKFQVLLVMQFKRGTLRFDFFYIQCKKIYSYINA